MYKPMVRPLLMLFCILFLVSAACSAPIRPSETPPAQPDQTQAVFTVEAMLTQISRLTATPGTITQPVPGQGSTPVAQATSATPQPQTSPTPLCDQAAFLRDVTIPDGTEFPSGTQFKKTWRLQNKGTCTWTPEYAVIFDSGDAMGGPTAAPIGVSVPPGGSVDVSVNLTAPGQPGTFRGLWKLRNAAGVTFGVGPAKSAFYVEIKVTTPATGVSGYDFAANVCAAEWKGGDKTIACLGREGDEDGFVLTVKRPILENGYVDDETALLTFPPRVNDGVIRGIYPSYTIQSGDVFRAIIGCEHNAKNCNVRFQLDFQIDNGPVQTIGSWNETYDESFTTVSQDLSNLVGKTVHFILTVYANGSPDQDRALWLLPRVE